MKKKAKESEKMKSEKKNERRKMFEIETTIGVAEKSGRWRELCK